MPVADHDEMRNMYAVLKLVLPALLNFLTLKFEGSSHSPLSVRNPPHHPLLLRLLSPPQLCLILSARCSSAGLHYCLRRPRLAPPHDPVLFPLHCSTHVAVVPRPLLLAPPSAVAGTALCSSLVLSRSETHPSGAAKDPSIHFRPLVMPSTSSRKSAPGSATVVPAGVQPVIVSGTKSNKGDGKQEEI